MGAKDAMEGIEPIFRFGDINIAIAITVAVLMYVSVDFQRHRNLQDDGRGNPTYPILLHLPSIEAMPIGRPGVQPESLGVTS